MSKESSSRPVSAPLCGPTDTIELVGGCCGIGRNANRQEWIYVVVHRSHGLWTHVYVVVEPPDCGGTEIRLVRVMAGDQLGAARAWALAMRGEDLAGRADASDKEPYGWGLAWCGGGLPAGEEHSGRSPASPLGDVAARSPPGRGERAFPVGHGGLRTSFMPVDGAITSVRAEREEEVV